MEIDFGWSMRLSDSKVTIKSVIKCGYKGIKTAVSAVGRRRVTYNSTI